MAAMRPRPHRPGAEREAARRAYLDLLKLALCDLVAGETESVVTTPEGPVSEPLPEESVSDRVEGREWPLRGLTMIGYDRLGDLQACVESVVADGVPGDVIEAGVWRGGSSILARATLDSLGDSDRMVWLADSFQGLPPPDEAFPEDEQMTLHRHEFLAVPRADVEAAFRRLGLDHDLGFIEGFFSETMPALRGRSWSIIRLDGDMYESTWLTLEALYPGLSRGGYLICDDYGEIAEGRRAVDEFRAANGIESTIERVDHTCVRWRREDEPAPISKDGPPRRRAGSAPEGPLSAPLVRTRREVEAAVEMRELRARIADLRNRIAQLEASAPQPRRIRDRARGWRAGLRRRW